MTYFIFRDFIGWRICNINKKPSEGNRTKQKTKKNQVTRYKSCYDCADIGSKVNKVKLIILSKISCDIYCDNDTIVLTGICLKDLIIL